MGYIKTYKAIRIDRNTLDLLNQTNSILNDIVCELNELAKEDEVYNDFANDAWHAEASLDDFLVSYRREIRGD